MTNFHSFCSNKTFLSLSFSLNFLYFQLSNQSFSNQKLKTSFFRTEFIIFSFVFFSLSLLTNLFFFCFFFVDFEQLIAVNRQVNKGIPSWETAFKLYFFIYFFIYFFHIFFHIFFQKTLPCGISLKQIFSFCFSLNF